MSALGHCVVIVGSLCAAIHFAQGSKEDPPTDPPYPREKASEFLDSSQSQRTGKERDVLV